VKGGEGGGYLDLAHGSSDDALEDRAPLVVQEVDLVNDEQPHQLGVGPVARLAGDDVPLLRGRHDDLHRNRAHLCSCGHLASALDRSRDSLLILTRTQKGTSFQKRYSYIGEKLRSGNDLLLSLDSFLLCALRFYDMKAQWWHNSISCPTSRMSSR